MKPKVSRGRVYPGEFCLPGDRTAAHRLFFTAIRDKTPRVLQSLHSEILPVFRQFCRKGFKGDQFYLKIYPRLWDWAAQHSLVAGDRFLPRDETCFGLTDQEIRVKVEAFQSSSEQTFFFPFALFAIFETLTRWLYDKKGAELDWDLPYSPYPIGDGCDLLKLRTFDDEFELSDLFIPPAKTISGSSKFEVPGWNPMQETRAQARDRILNQLKLDVDRKLDQAERCLALIGVSAAPAKVSTDHFEWLVLYQVAGMPFARIAKLDPNGPGPQAVTDGVKDAAQSVVGPAWKRWLRPSKPGRPKAE